MRIANYHQARAGGIEIRPDNQTAQLAAILDVIQTGARITDVRGRPLARAIHRGTPGIDARLELHFGEETRR